MSKNMVKSDQFYNWSDTHGTKHNESSPAKAKNTPPQVSSFAGHSARFTDRAIQALWQARMQMCGGTRPWPQVLPVHQLPQEEARDGLHPCRIPGKGENLFGELPQGKRNSRRTLLHQPRAFAAQGTFLGGPYGNLRRQYERVAFYQRRGDSPYLCQHVGTSDAIRCYFIYGGDP
jgi:hypothetical protein